MVKLSQDKSHVTITVTRSWHWYYILIGWVLNTTQIVKTNYFSFLKNSHMGIIQWARTTYYFSNKNIIFSQQTLRTFKSKHRTLIIKKDQNKKKKTAFYENNNISNTHHTGGNKVFIWCSRLTLNLLWQLISLNTIKTRPSKCVYITLISRWSALRHCPRRFLFDACNTKKQFLFLSF